MPNTTCVTPGVGASVTLGGRLRNGPVRRHAAEVEERCLVVGLDGVLDLVVEALAGLLGACDRDLLGAVADPRPLAVLGKAIFGGVPLGVAASEHLLERSETVV